MCLVLFGTVAFASITKAPTIHDIKSQATQNYIYIAEIYTTDRTLISYLPISWVKEELKRALDLDVVQYGGNYRLLYECIKQESQFNPLVKGDGGLAIGPAQIHLYYWNENCVGNRYNPYDNLECFVKQNIARKNPAWGCWKFVSS